MVVRVEPSVKHILLGRDVIYRPGVCEGHWHVSDLCLL